MKQCINQILQVLHFCTQCKVFLWVKVLGGTLCSTSQHSTTQWYHWQPGKEEVGLVTGCGTLYNPHQSVSVGRTVTTFCADSYYISSTPMLLQYHIKDPGYSAKSAGGKLQLNMHAPCVVYGMYQDGSSFMWHQPCQHCKYTTLVDIKKCAIKSYSLM